MRLSHNTALGCLPKMVPTASIFVGDRLKKRRQMHHPRLRFRTAVLNVEPERPNPINPVAGESLLRWLALHWQGESPITEPVPEDWGWCAYTSWNGRRYMLGSSCCDSEEGEREWVLQVVKDRSLIELILGRERRQSSDACLLEIKRLLRSEPAFRDLESFPK